MSGGQFNYIQRRLKDIADEIIELLKELNYEPSVGRRFHQASKAVKLAGLMIHRIDWLVSGDDGPETFLKLWPSENHCEDCAAFTERLVNIYVNRLP